MKNIIYNEDKLTDKDINRLVKRAKLLLINSNDEFLLCHSGGAYHILGGHVDNNESDVECILREAKEEAGLTIRNLDFKPIMQIIYYCKDHPKLGINSKYIANYYYQKSDLMPHMEKTHLTIEEINENFVIEQIAKDKVLDILNAEYIKNGKQNVMRDTIQVITEYLKNN